MNATNNTEESTMTATNYSIDTGDGNQITAGLPPHTARATAQRIANERGESVYLYGDDGAEAEEIEPTSKFTAIEIYWDTTSPGWAWRTSEARDDDQVHQESGPLEVDAGDAELQAAFDGEDGTFNLQTAIESELSIKYSDYRWRRDQATGGWTGTPREGV
jgi:hypothetical protein